MPKKLHPASAASDLDLEASGSSSPSDEENFSSDHLFDISSALTQRKSGLQKNRGPLAPREDDIDDDTDLEDMIRNSISRRNVKDGTELLKNTKGKKKLTKGEVGGGSFQSMGTTVLSLSLFVLCILQLLSCRTLPLDFTFPDTTRFPHTYSYSATFYPHPSRQPTS